MATVGLQMRWYGHGLAAFLRGELDWEGDTIRVALTTAGYVPDQGAHEYWDDVTDEVTDTGYTAGGAVLDNASLTYDPGESHVTLDADDVEWDPASIVAAGVVVYQDTGNPGTSRLIGYGTGGAAVSSENDLFAVRWHPEGILRATAVQP